MRVIRQTQNSNCYFLLVAKAMKQHYRECPCFAAAIDCCKLLSADVGSDSAVLCVVLQPCPAGPVQAAARQPGDCTSAIHDVPAAALLRTHAVVRMPSNMLPLPTSCKAERQQSPEALALVRQQGRVAVAAAAWAAAAAHWLAWAYLLEFRGALVHLAVWAAGLVFLAANVALLCVLSASFAQPSKVVRGAAAAVPDRHAGVQDVPVQTSRTVIGGNGQSRTH